MRAALRGDQLQGRERGHRLQRLGASFDHGRTGDGQEIADQVRRRSCRGDQLRAAPTQVPQVRARLIQLLRDVAVQLNGQPGDQHAIGLIGLMSSIIMLRRASRQLWSWPASSAPRPSGSRRRMAEKISMPFSSRLTWRPASRHAWYPRTRVASGIREEISSTFAQVSPCSRAAARRYLAQSSAERICPAVSCRRMRSAAIRCSRSSVLAGPACGCWRAGLGHHRPPSARVSGSPSWPASRPLTAASQRSRLFATL